MRIRTQLVALVAGVALPLFLLSGFLTYQLWQNQRNAYLQQFLERAGAVRLALETEFDVTMRTLRTIGDASEIPEPEVEVVLRRRFRRLLDNNPDWALVALTDAQGTVAMRDGRDGAPPIPALDAQSVAQALASDKGFISNLVTTQDGQHLVYIATAIRGDGGMQGVIYTAIRHSHWLRLLRSYPVSPQGTLTLLDAEATVVTRTVGDSEWTGHKAPSEFWNRVRSRPEDSFRTAGMDGVPYYLAFTRSSGTDWVVATGVPESEVDTLLYRHVVVVMLVSIVALLGALLVAWRLGKDIHASMRGLLGAAHRLGDLEPANATPLPIQEAETVRGALLRAETQLQTREASLNAALEREAAARNLAESGNRAKDQFLAMMGHELRNPLGAIASAADALDADADAQSAARSRKIIRRQTSHLAAMVNDLMDVAQLESGGIVLHRAPLDLAQLVAKVVVRFEETGRSAHLRTRTVLSPAWIDADEARTELIVTCLLDNACKYTPSGGTVTLEVLAEADASILRVRDTGMGITAQLMESMFDTFSQGGRGIERAEGGLGLGLALARRLAQLHGGTLSAASDGPGHGAVFSVTFPRVQPPVPAPALPPPPPVTDGASAATPVDTMVLTIVEDIDDTRESMELILEADGRRVNSAADGPEGVRVILEGPSDVALVDIGLPGFDGYEVARRVRQAPGGAGVLLVALTGYGTEADRATAMDAGFDHFLVKPFDRARFEAMLPEMLAARAHPDNERPAA